MLQHPFPPLYDKNSKILILGSFPSVKSREQMFFYGHPQNRFWKVISRVLEQETPITIEEKRDFLLSNNIALWDVIASCDITGSSDSSIKNVVTNDLTEILGNADIKKIFVNGKTAEKYYNKYIRNSINRDAICLPSTSPANAGWSVERLVETWRVVKVSKNNNMIRKATIDDLSSISKLYREQFKEMYRFVNCKLKEYIETNILPEYSKNDDGHNIEHIIYVINRCFLFAEQFDNIDFNMLYTAAAFHDIAHHIDKNNHEVLSAKIFFENEDMKLFFTDEERIIIKKGIEDHRASSKNTPRNIYGKILSSADRSTDVDEFLKRTHAYTLKHQPDCTVEEMIERAYNHTKDKYGTDGYAKHYVVDEEYNQFRNEIANLINDKEKFKIKYLKVNNM